MWIIVITPTMAYSWPAIVPIVTAVLAVKGFEALTTNDEYGVLNRQLRQRLNEENVVRVGVSDVLSETLKDEVKRDEILTFRKGEIILELIRDVRGALKVQVTGPQGMKKKEMEALGREFAEEVAQLIRQHQVVEQMQKLGAEVVGEEVNTDGDIVLRMRKY